MSDPPELWKQVERSVTCLVCRKTPGTLNFGDMCQTHWDEFWDQCLTYNRRGFGSLYSTIAWMAPEGLYCVNWGKK